VARVLTVLAHGDADGVSSAAVVKAALAGEYEAVRVHFTHPVDLAKDFGAFAEGDVYVVDVAIDERTAEEVRRAFRSYGGRVVYIDHHPLSVDLRGSRWCTRRTWSRESFWSTCLGSSGTSPCGWVATRPRAAPVHEWQACNPTPPEIPKQGRQILPYLSDTHHTLILLAAFLMLAGVVPAALANPARSPL